MGGRDSPRPDDDLATMADGVAAVRAPSDPGVSSSHPSDSDLEITKIESGPDSPTLIDGLPTPPLKRVSPAGSGFSSQSSSLLPPGAVLGQRYVILQILGQGGMGAVYKARDREVDRVVALKVIRPDLAGNAAIIDRFKQELVLSHQVTHKNVVRIYDLGEADGVKFITMEYIEGKDLRTLIQETKAFSPEEAVENMRQVCRALEAAHAVGVIHRDLKPQNIMRDNQGRVVVMDFGLARSLDSNDGMTQTGAVIGTMEYMSPEQGLGKQLDQRSDLFTVGLIFYELLTGKMPYKSDSALASLLKRTQERAAPVSQHNSKIPSALSNIVAKCLEPDLKTRYQHVVEVLTDLEAWQGKDAAVSLQFPAVKPWARTLPWPAIGIAVTVIVLALSGYLVRDKLVRSGKGTTGPQVSLAILPLRNASGDASLDWMGKSLAEMLRTDVGQSENCRVVPPERLHQILTDLRISPDTELDANTIRRIAEFTSADQIVWGQYIRVGDQIRVDATLEDLKSERTTPIKGEAPNEKALLATVDQLAKAIQDNLALSPKSVGQMKAAAFTPSSKSIDALRDYSLGLELSREANHIEAAKKFESATKEDPNFALAFSMLGKTYASLGYEKQAEQYSSKAAELSGSLPDAERYLIQATDAHVEKNYGKAVEAYENLIKLMPNDPQVQFEMGSLYEGHGVFDQAREHYLKALQTDPKYLNALLAVGTVELKAGNAQSSLDYLNRALSLAVELNNLQGKANVLQEIGDAYQMMNKPTDALQNCQQSLEIKKQLGDKQGMGASLDEMAQIYQGMGKPKDAENAYREALKLQTQIGDQTDSGITTMNLGLLLQNEGRYEEALKLTKQALQIELQVGDQNIQSICLNNIGNIYFSQGQYDEALTYFQQSLELTKKLNVPSNLAMTLNNVGETYRKLGQYDQATSNYLSALEVSRKAGDKLGVAAISDSMASLFEIQGRYGAALDAEQDAAKNIRDLQTQDANRADIESNYGNVMALVGRNDEAQKILDNALALARSLQNNSLVAKSLRLQGERLLYRNDFKAERPLFEQALQTATKAKDRNETLLSKFDLARSDIKEGRASAAAANLKALAKEADSLGEKYISNECSLSRGEALVKSKDYSAARQELESTLRVTQASGMGSLLAQSHYWLAMALQSSGDKGGAATHFQQASQLAEQMHKESRSDALLKRDDLRPIVEQARN